MNGLPLPPTLRSLVALPGKGSRSLAFDRGFDRYDGRWSIPAGDKQEFLKAFRRRHSRPGDYEPFIARRRSALEAAGARPVPLYLQTRLVVGLGLPHPTETALLLDRMTGCPYIPGSSIKGALREGARLAAKGELTLGEQDAPAFWHDHLDLLFGPMLDGEKPPAKGLLVLYDAFPEEWPTLEVDVLTPHYQPYYSDDGSEPSEPPADWHDPNPVAFLTVAAGTKFTFWVGSRKPPGTGADLDPEEALERTSGLISTALAWLGLGGKTSSGYGLFSPTPPPAGETRFDAGPEAPAKPDPRVPSPPPEPAARKSHQETYWPGVTLKLERGTATIFRGKKERAQAKKGDLPRELEERLRKEKKLQVDAWVTKGVRGLRIVRVEGWED